MAKIEPRTLKGFRDFLPNEARKRQYVIDSLKSVFESFGFEPLETPALEYEEILAGKYGKEGDQLMYRFEDLGKRRVALRYDQTVPLSRVVAQYASALPTPFKRYQIQPVWRAENTQRGRYREFLQCDADIAGIDSPLADAEIIAVTASALNKLGFEDFTILINDRSVFGELTADEMQSLSDKELPGFIRSLDKIKKIGRDKVIEELESQGINREKAAYLLNKIEQTQPNSRIKEIMEYLELLGVRKSNLKFLPTLARGLDYYTGLIFEIEIEGYSAGSVCGGGRYNNLIGMFSGNSVPAAGFAFGFDRLMEAMETLNLFPENLETTRLLITVFSAETKQESLQILKIVRDQGINAEIYLDPSAKMDRQLKYADRKNIPTVIILGPEEIASKSVTLKIMKTGEQKTVSASALAEELA